MYRTEKYSVNLIFLQFCCPILRFFRVIISEGSFLQTQAQVLEHMNLGTKHFERGPLKSVSGTRQNPAGILENQEPNCDRAAIDAPHNWAVRINLYAL
ncbi:hypothetical protein CLOSTMETH_02265 [[Clostridium] methylpentosum DSM 5476]|uniref:Uncharacterized protein n=1 Tax=[Clostridium] methylpentosum DSM 5476 TaxID=537013 RepID=C0EEH9_9FIRM|nr:hypothetical protein CLOSTMETH_02265 [[Clostridium] methylpentosum DSM 5476]